MKHFIFIILIILTKNSGFGQTAWDTRRDSLFNVLSKQKEDSNKGLTMAYLGMLYMYNQPDSSVYYLKELGKLSRRVHYVRGMVNSLSLQAGILADHDQPDAAIALDSEAMRIAIKENYPKVLAIVYNNIAIPYANKGDYSSSLYYYLKAASLDEKLNDSFNLSMAYSNIGGVYNRLNEYKKGYEYSLKGMLISRLQNHLNALESGLTNLGSALVSLKRYDTALTVLQECGALSKQLNDNSTTIQATNNICIIYIRTGKYDMLKKTAEELLTLSIAADDKEGICNAWGNLSDYFFYKKDYAKAKYYNQEAIQSAIKNKLIEILKYAYEGASAIELAQGNVPDYDHYKNLKDSIDNILLSDKILKNTQDLEAKYFLSKKQVEIDNLNKEEKIEQLTLRQRNTINRVLTGAILVFVLMGFLYYRNYQQKQKLLLADALLQQQRITELGKENQLLAANAVLQGQTEERTRLAKDLHDGLGGILSSAKYSFGNMKDNLIITSQNADAFDKSMALLDKSISELRRVAHNMMPEALMEFGLDTALKDFCNSINQSGAIQLMYQSFDMDENSISKNTSSAIYRIIQELVNNILKHADAKTALVQLIRKNDVLSITVEDNGKGFDKNTLSDNNGMGYVNLQNRVTYLKGTIDIQTAKDKGTSVNIEIPNIAA